MAILLWEPINTCRQAVLGTRKDGVLFELFLRPTCYRRGQHLLQIEVFGGPHHHDWGCFDAADQPMRYYHNEVCALLEAEAIAQVLWHDRYPTRLPPRHPTDPMVQQLLLAATAHA